MTAKLFYLPLEPYIERYTWFMSARDGWTETSFKDAGVDFERIEGEPQSGTITAGVVLDAFGRSRYALTQASRMVERIQAGDVHDGDVIYCEDFWHPGIEALFYIRAVTGIAFKVGTFLHAQSVDEHDFTYPMRDWMRPFEVGLSRGYDYVFVCSPELKVLAINGGLDENKIHVVGLPFNSGRLLEQLRIGYKPKEDYVLFSSRFDAEKGPHFFLNVVEECADVEFILVKPRAVISNDASVRDRLDIDRPANLRIVDTSQSKDAYYQLLMQAKVQFNCALQDWVSWTLLEAVLFECNPLYPRWRDFPRELSHDRRYLYTPGDVHEAAHKIRALMDIPFDPILTSIVTRHDQTWKRFLEVML